MTGVILIAFLWPMLHAICILIDSHISNNLFKKYTAIIFYASLTNIIAAAMVLFFGMPQAISLSTLFFLFLISFIGVFYQFPYYMAHRKGDASVTCALFSLAYVFVPVLAYLFVGERLKIIQYVGIGLILIASLALNLNGIKKVKLNLAFYLMLLVAFLLSLELVIYKYVLDTIDWISAIFYTSVLSLPITLSFLLFKKSRHTVIQALPEYKKRFKYFIGNELFYQSGHLAGIFAMSFLPVTVLEGIGSTQALFVLFFGFILYRLFGHKGQESLSKKDIVKKTLCYVTIIAGVILLIN
ncbi:MAG: EamA family transporter [Lactobacillales bacterium]|jgi:uncharacterized membrane protein|nr:EamA family transporter [Lactobacillales bacterium]